MDLLKNRIVVRIIAAIAIVFCLFYLLVECKTNFEHRIGYSPIIKINVAPLSELNVEQWVIKR